MNDKEIEILNKIVDAGGACLIHSLCDRCPFRKTCLPRFTSGEGISREERAAWAADALARIVLIGDSE